MLLYFNIYKVRTSIVKLKKIKIKIKIFIYNFFIIENAKVVKKRPLFIKILPNDYLNSLNIAVLA